MRMGSHNLLIGAIIVGVVLGAITLTDTIPVFDPQPDDADYEFQLRFRYAFLVLGALFFIAASKQVEKLLGENSPFRKLKDLGLAIPQVLVSYMFAAFGFGRFLAILIFRQAFDLFSVIIGLVGLSLSVYFCWHEKKASNK